MLKINPELDEFRINTNAPWELKPLAQFLNMRRAFFLDRDQEKVLVDTMATFKAKIETDIENSDDRKGNSVKHFGKKLITDMKLSFNLNIPLYVGFKAKSFPVEILADVTDSSVRFFLESVELREMQIDERDNALEFQIKSFKCAVIEV